jgi:predicted membrane-bound spermidine synthase
VVEVNPAMVDLLQAPFAEFVGDPLSNPAVNVTEGDGRFFVARSDDVYDVIQLTGVDTAVASAAGSPNLAENYLYTQEAFRLYFDHLSPDGLLAVSFPNVEGMGLRLVNLVALTLAQAGIERPEDHIVVSEITGYVHILMKRTPFTEKELRVLEDGFRQRVSSVYFPLYHRLFGDPPQAFVQQSAIIASPRTEWPGVYGA